MAKAGTITITWASSIENHKGMEVIGDIGGTGHTFAHLSKCMEKFEEKKKVAVSCWILTN